VVNHLTHAAGEWDESASASGRCVRQSGVMFESFFETRVRVGDRRLNVTESREITERTHAEAALRESEQKFRGLFEASSDGILILDPENGRITDCNAAALRMKGGGDREWLLAQSIESLSTAQQPDGRASSEAAQAWIERALAEGPQRLEWMAKRYGGEPFPVEVLLTPLRLGGRRLLVVASRDISERKKTELELLELNRSLERRVAERTAALASSEAGFRALVEHAPEAIVVFDGDTGRFRFGNEHACALYGVPMERLTELTPADVSPELQPNGRLSAELVRERMEEALAGGTPVFEWIHRHADGILVPTEVRLLRLPVEGQNLIRASIIDNTERKRAERTLRESEEKFRALFEGSSQGVVLHDERQILEANPAALRILELQGPRELLGKHPSHTSPPLQPNGESSAELAGKYIQECMDNGSARFEWMSCTARGRAIPLEVSLTRIQWSGRQVIQALIHDISQRKQAEAELHRTLAREMELSQLKSNFVSMVSHEFRTPLGIIQSSAELLRDFYEKMPLGERSEQLESITRNTRRMAGMMEEILILSRLDAGKLDFQPAALDLNVFCHRLVDEVLSATNRRCVIELSLASVPPEARADEKLLGHILTNLLSNAVKYSEPGATVHFAIRRDAADVLCIVRDQGIGISAGDQQHLFKAFHRGDNVGTRPGTGLGLLMVKRCVELHRGSVEVSSQLGEGTTVTVRLPVFGPTV
jgi:PAS domain S-box-containing protein